MNPGNLDQQRMEVAIASGGCSSEPVYRLVAREIDARASTGPILEVGAGHGLLTLRLLKPGRTLTCLDLLPRPASLPGEVIWVRTDLNEPMPLPAESFEAVICSEVIAYLENPHALFREFYRLLRPAGTLIVTTPNQESLRSLLSVVLEGHFMAFRRKSHPGHITALLRLDFERLCAQAGFPAPEFRHTDDGGLPKFPNITWQRAFFGLPRGRWFSDNVLMVTQKTR